MFKMRTQSCYMLCVLSCITAARSRETTCVRIACCEQFCRREVLIITIFCGAAADDDDDDVALNYADRRSYNLTETCDFALKSFPHENFFLTFVYGTRAHYHHRHRNFIITNPLFVFS
jgi:hypothetical protein